MARSHVLKWLQRGWESFVDPEKSERVNQIVVHLRNQIAKQKRDFSLEAATKKLDLDADELRLAREQVYREYLERALDDGHLTERERGSLDWLIAALQLTTKQHAMIDTEVGERAFGTALANAVEDGFIDDEEARQLHELASWMGTSVKDFVSDFFRKQGERFLQSMFLAATQDGELFEEEWRRFQLSAQRLGFRKSEASLLVRPYAEQFIEHVLADAKSDEFLSRNEEKTLAWLLSELAVSTKFQSYVRDEIAELRIISDIRDGKLPSLSGKVPAEIRAGEIVHFFGAAKFERVRKLKSGPRHDVYKGDIVITDSRLIFSSAEYPLTLNLRSVISLSAEDRFVDVRATKSATGRLSFGAQTKLAGLILTTAVRRANQTIVEKPKDGPNRHIPRDVRQRVWQRYGGKCVDCGSTHYLEFDHIIPVAKGGSNSDNNIQLLCRGCNLKKSDSI